MLPGMELLGCQIEVPASVMQHVVKVESSYNPYAIGVVRGRLARQPRNLEEAVATAKMLEAKGFNFSLGLAQVNRYNLKKYGIHTYAQAFEKCSNLLAGSRILLECNNRAGGHWGKSFSCYYSGNFTTGYREGYVQKVERSLYAQSPQADDGIAISVVATKPSGRKKVAIRQPPSASKAATEVPKAAESLVARRGGVAEPQSTIVESPESSPPPQTHVDKAFVF